MSKEITTKVKTIKKIDLIKTTKHKEVLIEYLSNGRNAKRAYKKIYPSVSDATAETNGPKILRNALVKAALKEHDDEKWEARKDRLNEMLDKFIDIADSDISDVVEYDGKELKIKKLKDIKNTKVIHEIKHKVSDTKYGENIEKSVKMYDKVKALENIAKILNMIADKTELTGTIEIIPAKRPSEDEYPPEEKEVNQ